MCTDILLSVGAAKTIERLLVHKSHIMWKRSSTSMVLCGTWSSVLRVAFSMLPMEEQDQASFAKSVASTTWLQWILYNKIIVLVHMQCSGLNYHSTILYNAGLPYFCPFCSTTGAGGIICSICTWAHLLVLNVDKKWRYITPRYTIHISRGIFRGGSIHGSGRE